MGLETIRKSLQGVSAVQRNEVLEQFKEYPVQAAAAGLSMEKFAVITVRALQEGVFSDKGNDAIKEAGERIGRLEKPALESLKAIGLNATAIEQGISAGTLAIDEVIQMAAKRLGELDPQAAITKQALEGIFGTPGVDAGLRYITLLGDMDKV